jgi:hypothetical protein
MNNAANGGQGLAIDDLSFSAVPNTAPLLGGLSNRLVHAGQTISFAASATDAERPPQVLTFSLDPGAPAGSVIDPITGAFTWVTTNAPVPSTNNITIRVTDDGIPPLSTAGTFSVTVAPLPQLAAGRPVGSMLPLSFSSLPGQTYQVQYKDRLADPTWTPLNAPVPGDGGEVEVDDDMSGHDQRFYRLVVMPQP